MRSRCSTSACLRVLPVAVIAAAGMGLDACAGEYRHSGSTTTTTQSASTTSRPSTTSTTVAVPLQQGDAGESVSVVQARLFALGYWAGPGDGVFDGDTRHAVVALQKAAGLERTGVMDEATRQALDDGVVPRPRSGTGRMVEIDLERQLLLVVSSGRLEATFDASTGSVPGTTPRGQWEVVRQIDGARRAPNGLLYRPKYFHQGVAIHGYTSVPPAPASHGCVRVTYPAMDRIWEADLMPVGTPVWVY